MPPLRWPDWLMLGSTVLLLGYSWVYLAAGPLRIPDFIPTLLVVLFSVMAFFPRWCNYGVIRLHPHNYRRQYTLMARFLRSYALLFALLTVVGIFAPAIPDGAIGLRILLAVVGLLCLFGPICIWQVVAQQ